MNLNPRLIAQIQAISAEIRAAMEDDDEQAFIDTLDGETPAIELLDRFILESIQSGAMEAAARELAQRFTKRAQGFAARKEAARKAAALVMEAMGETRVKRPHATLSLKPGAVSVLIDNPADIPSQLRKPGDPDKTAIRKHLEQGETVPGARLVTGDTTISMRVA